MSVHVELPDGQSAEMREKVSVRGRSIQNAYLVVLEDVLPKLRPLAAQLAESHPEGMDTTEAKEQLAALAALGDGDPGKLTPADLIALDEWKAAMVLARLTSWTLSAHLPSSVEALQEAVDGPIFDVLFEEAAKLNNADRRPDLSPDAAMADKDRVGPTGPSSASDGAERAAAE